jgi:hypothetical protein
MKQQVIFDGERSKTMMKLLCLRMELKKNSQHQQKGKHMQRRFHCFDFGVCRGRAGLRRKEKGTSRSKLS